VCRFSSPFVQESLFAAFSADMFGDKGPLPAVRTDDDLEDVFTNDGIRVPRLLERYRDYLQRLNKAGIDPWVGQPRRQDLHYTEAVGHFHLHSWMQQAILGYGCVVSPEFPTGNGKVDLILRTKHHLAVIEVKSYISKPLLRSSRVQAAGYAKKLSLSDATLVVFAPTNEADVVATLEDDSIIDGVRVVTVPFGWV
jgi:hypothetical protein